MMPELNGYEVLERLQADERLRHVPVIMISAVDEIESVVRCIELGAEDYLPKPFNPTLLRARVGASLEKKRLRDQIVAHLGRIERELATAREIQLSMVPGEFPAPTADASAGDLRHPPARAAGRRGSVRLLLERPGRRSASSSPTCPTRAPRPRSSWPGPRP